MITSQIYSIYVISKNLLAVNIHMQEISSETVEQKIAYGFWTLIGIDNFRNYRWCLMNDKIHFQLISAVPEVSGWDSTVSSVWR